MAKSVIVARDIAPVEATNPCLHVYRVSTAGSMDALRRVKGRSIRVTAETVPRHLYLTTPEIVRYDITSKVNPPPHTGEHVGAIRVALTGGTIDAVTVDHTLHAPRNKDHVSVDARPGMLEPEQTLAVVTETMVAPGRLT